MLVDDMISLDKRYVGLFINSALGDIVNLKNYDTVDHFLFAGQDGSGKNRDVAKGFVKKRIQALIDVLIKYSEQKNCYIFCSSDGGSGSGSSILIAKALRKACPDKNIGIIGIIPKLSENQISLKNATEFWNDLINLKNKKLVDTIYLIDNNKRHTYEEINKEATKALDMAFSLNTFDTTGTIDQNDSNRVNTAIGYNFIMPLDVKYTNLQMAIDNSIKNSVFLPPPSYDCDYLGAVVQKEYFNVEDLRSKFEVFKVDYCGYSNSENVIVLSGLSVPREGIDILQVALKDVEDKVKSKYKENDLHVWVKDDEAIIEKDIDKGESNTINSSTVNAQTLEKMFSDNFWDD